MARVFLSHASEDQRPTDDVQEWLLDGDHEVFLDRDLRNGIALGEEWEERLHERLRWADAVVCVVTSAYISSLWCTAEVGIARSRGCRLLPVLAESGARHPLLASLQHFARCSSVEQNSYYAPEFGELVTQLHHPCCTQRASMRPFRRAALVDVGLSAEHGQL